MSEENVKLIHRTFASINRGDIDGALDVVADDFEMDWSDSIGPAKGVYRGKEQVHGIWTSFVEAFEELRWDPEEIIEVDESRLIVINRVRIRGRGSGVEVDATGAQLWTFGGGRALSIKLYQSKAEALEAAGLSE